MSKLILTLLLTIPNHALAINNTDHDKDKHFAATSMISTVSYVYFRKQGYSKTDSAKAGFVIALTIGVTKELTDDEIDGEDIFADILGAGIPLFAVQF